MMFRVSGYLSIQRARFDAYHSVGNRPAQCSICGVAQYAETSELRRRPMRERWS